MTYSTVDILLFEDNLHDAALILETLQRKDYYERIIHIDNGEDVLNFLLARNSFSCKNINNKPKVILFGRSLQNQTGLEILKELKKKESTKNIPVVILSSSGLTSDINESYKFGVNGYIVKPVDPAKFSETIENICQYWLILNKRPY